jgi:dTDP-glucose 4,6-dehydratase
MNWEKKRVLITGAGGFIGSHLAERLSADGAEVRCMVHYRGNGSRGWLENSPLADQSEFTAGDIRDYDCVKRAMEGVDVVFHLAALIAIPYSFLAPESYVQTNVAGTTNVLRAARDLGTALLVHTSTSEVYGSAQCVPMSEDHPVNTQSPYAASKSGADMMVNAFSRSYGLPVVTVRPFNTFGPRQSARAVIPTIIAQCLAGSSCIQLGNATPLRDLNYVSNTVDGFVAAAAVPEAVGRTFNIGSGREVRIAELARMIVRLSGIEATVECDDKRVRPEASEVNRLLADVSNARDCLGWEPKVSLEEGLHNTIGWMRSNANAYRAEVYEI